MLRSIHLRNFKRYGEEGARFTLAPVTLLLGPNSAGKSTLLQALLLLKQSWESDSASLTSLLHLDLQGPLVDLGHSRNVVHRHDESRVIEIELETSGGRCNLSYLGDNSSPRLKLLSIEIFAANLSQGVAPSQQPGPTDGSPELRLSVADGKLVLDRACALYQRLWALARADGGLQREHCLTLELEALEWRLALSTLPADRAEPSQKGDESADPDDIQSTSAVEGQMIASRQFWRLWGVLASRRWRVTSKPRCLMSVTKSLRCLTWARHGCPATECSGPIVDRSMRSAVVASGRHTFYPMGMFDARSIGRSSSLASPTKQAFAVTRVPPASER
jgi:hypothetical protein